MRIFLICDSKETEITNKIHHFKKYTYLKPRTFIPLFPIKELLSNMTLDDWIVTVVAVINDVGSCLKGFFHDPFLKT